MRNDTEAQIWAEFMKGFDCGQVVLRRFAPELGLDTEIAAKIASPFGAGAFKGDTCGAVEGAYIVLGLKFGWGREGEGDKKPLLIQKLREFDERFQAKESYLVCEDILGGNILTDGERLQEEKVMQKKCPAAVIHAIAILNEIGGF